MAVNLLSFVFKFPHFPEFQLEVLLTEFKILSDLKFYHDIYINQRIICAVCQSQKHKNFLLSLLLRLKIQSADTEPTHGHWLLVNVKKV